MVLSKSYPNLINFLISLIGSILLVILIRPNVCLLCDAYAAINSTFIYELLRAYNLVGDNSIVCEGLVLLILFLSLFNFCFVLQDKRIRLIQLTYISSILVIYCLLFISANQSLVFALISMLFFGISTHCAQRSSKVIALMLGIITYPYFGMLIIVVLTVINCARNNSKHLVSKELLANMDAVIFSSLTLLAFHWIK